MGYFLNSNSWIVASHFLAAFSDLEIIGCLAGRDVANQPIDLALHIYQHF